MSAPLWLRLRRSTYDSSPAGRMVCMEADTPGKVALDASVVSASLAFRLARFVEFSIDDLLAGKYSPHGRVRTAGRHRTLATRKHSTNKIDASRYGRLMSRGKRNYSRILIW